MSPTPGRSILMQSAPRYPRSWVQVGPDCTCVKSRTLTPSSALPACPQGLVEGGGSISCVTGAERLTSTFADAEAARLTATAVAFFFTTTAGLDPTVFLTALLGVFLAAALALLVFALIGMFISPVRSISCDSISCEAR